RADQRSPDAGRRRLPVDSRHPPARSRERQNHTGGGAYRAGAHRRSTQRAHRGVSDAPREARRPVRAGLEHRATGAQKRWHPDCEPLSVSSAVPATHRCTVLVVEDDADVRELLRFALSADGYEVATVDNGREAMHYLRSHADACIILLDLALPIMDGAHFRSAQLRDRALAWI